MLYNQLFYCYCDDPELGLENGCRTMAIEDTMLINSCASYIVNNYKLCPRIRKFVLVRAVGFWTSSQ